MPSLFFSKTVWTAAESLLFHENLRICFAKSCHQSFCLLLKPAIYPVSDHSCPSSLVFPLCQFEGRKDRVLPSCSDDEGFGRCFQTWSN